MIVEEGEKRWWSIDPTQTQRKHSCMIWPHHDTCADCWRDYSHPSENYPPETNPRGRRRRRRRRRRRVSRSSCAKESELQKGIFESKHVLPVESRNRLLRPLLQLRQIRVPHFSRQGVDLLCLFQLFGPCSSRSLFSKPDGRRKWIHDEWWGGGGGSWQYGRGTWGLQRTRWPKQNHPFPWEKKLLLSNTWIKQQASLFDPRTSITRHFSNNEPPCSIQDIVHWAMDLFFKLIFWGFPFSPFFAAIFWEHALTFLWVPIFSVLFVKVRLRVKPPSSWRYVERSADHS